MRNRNAFRDLMRRRRVSRHERRHGPVYKYHGLKVEVPMRVGVGVCNALLRGKYEPDEAAMIIRHLPANVPVIELGGSLGVISTLVRSRIGSEARHLVVEANAKLIDICRANAERDAAPGTTDIVNAALYYDGPVARFRIGRDVHSNAVDDGRQPGQVVEVPAVKFSQLHERIGAPSRFSLVSDIEGGEYDLFVRDCGQLERIDTAIVELHPQAYAMHGGSVEQIVDQCGRAGLALVDQSNDVYVFSRRAAGS